MGVTILEALCNEVQKAGQRPNLASVVGNKQALILQCVKDDPMERIKSDKIPKKLAGMIWTKDSPIELIIKTIFINSSKYIVFSLFGKLQLYQLLSPSA